MHAIMGALDVHILTWRRPDAFNLLWTSLQATLPPTVPIICTVHQDGMPDLLTASPDQVNADWTRQRDMLLELKELHGQRIHLDLQVTARGLKNSMLSITPSRGSCGMILLEDDLEVSPLLLRFAEAFARRYGPSDADGRILGVNLFTHVSDDISKLERPSSTSRRLSRPDGPYATSVPSSWGALYLGDSFSQFTWWVLYRHGLGRDPKFPSDMAQLNKWPAHSSWKKYLVAFMRACARYMVEVRFDNATLITNQVRGGVHFNDAQAKAQRWALAPAPLLQATDLPRLGQSGLSPQAVLSSAAFSPARLPVYNLTQRLVPGATLATMRHSGCPQVALIGNSSRRPPGG